MEVKIRQNIKAKLKSLGIGAVYLFGSQAQGTASFASDIDIGVVFIDSKKALNQKRYSETYLKLFDVFSDLFVKKGKINIDIVPLQIAPYSIRFEAIKHGRVLYEVSPEFRANFEEIVIKMYLDFKPLLEEHYRAVLERIK